MIFSEFTTFDIVVVVILLCFLTRGLWIGFMRQLAGLAALVGGYWLAAHFHPEIAPYVKRFIANPKLIFLVSFICIFLVSALAFTLAGKLLQKVMQITLMGWFDRLLGGILGIAKAAVVASLLFMFLASTLSASNELLAKSFSAPYLKIGAEQLKQVINDPRLLEYLKPKELAIQLEKEPRKVVKAKTEK